MTILLEGEERFGDLETPAIIRKREIERAEAEDSAAEDQREEEK